MKKWPLLFAQEAKARTPAAGLAGPRSAGKIKQNRMRVEWPGVEVW